MAEPVEPSLRRSDAAQRVVITNVAILVVAFVLAGVGAALVTFGQLPAIVLMVAGLGLAAWAHRRMKTRIERPQG